MQIDPSNKQISLLTNIGWKPSQEDVDSISAALSEARDNAANAIANGHGFEDHASEFGLGSTSADRLQYESYVNSVLNNYTQSGGLANGRSYYYHAPSNVLVIVDPVHPDGGTAFRPSGGASYLNTLK